MAGVRVTALHLLGAALLGALLAFAALFRRKPAPPAPRPDEERSRAESQARLDAARKAAADRQARDLARDPVELSNEWIREERERRGGG